MSWAGSAMGWLLALVVLALALAPLVISIRRSTELFKLRVQSGQVRFVRGRIPQALLTDIGDVVRAPRVERAELRAVQRSGHAELVARGELSPEQLQRLRNVLAGYSLQRIRAGGRPRRRR